jgi:hypothetical protein
MYNLLTLAGIDLIPLSKGGLTMAFISICVVPATGITFSLPFLGFIDIFLPIGSYFYGIFKSFIENLNFCNITSSSSDNTTFTSNLPNPQGVNMPQGSHDMISRDENTTSQNVSQGSTHKIENIVMGTVTGIAQGASLAQNLGGPTLAIVGGLIGGVTGATYHAIKHSTPEELQIASEDIKSITSPPRPDTPGPHEPFGRGS